MLQCWRVWMRVDAKCECVTSYVVMELLQMYTDAARSGSVTPGQGQQHRGMI